MHSGRFLMLSWLEQRLNKEEMMERGISRIQMIRWLPGWVDTIIRDANGANAGARVRVHAGPGSVFGGLRVEGRGPRS